jgi:hypothetical protein
VGVRHDAVHDRRVERCMQPGLEQLVGIGVGEAADGELGQPPEPGRIGTVARGEHHPDRLCEEATGDEGQGPGRGTVEPVRVIDEADEGALLSHLGQHAEHRQADEEAVRWVAGGQPERLLQRVALRRREVFESIEQRGAHHVEADSPRRGRPRTRAGRSSPPPLRRGGPTPGSDPPARSPPGGRAPGTHGVDHAVADQARPVAPPRRTVQTVSLGHLTLESDFRRSSAR